MNSSLKFWVPAGDLSEGQAMLVAVPATAKPDRQAYQGMLAQKLQDLVDESPQLARTALEMSLELYEELVKSDAFADGIDMAAPFNMSITVKAGVAPYTSIEFVWEGVRLERPNMDWKKGSSDLPVQVPYKCTERTMDGIPC